MKLVLASNSPRRKELLKKGGYDFTVISSSFEEKISVLDPISVAESFSFGKAINVYNSLKNKDNVIVLGADTVVYYNGIILPKPENELKAREMLNTLSGEKHEVITGYALIAKNLKEIGHDITKVEFNKLSDELIDEYIKSGLYNGKAGGYGIQDGYPLVKRYTGSLNNVIGLPTELVFPILNRYVDSE